MSSGKVRLFIFALAIVVWQSLLLGNEYFSLKAALNNEPRVLGATTTLNETFRILPDYPVLTQPAPAFAARHYALLDVESGIFLVEEEADGPVAMASTTKIMTAMLALEYGKNSDIYTVDQKSSAQIGSTVSLRPGEKISIDNLLYCALLNSGNDAAFSLGDYVGGRQLGGENDETWEESVKQFVDLMNTKARTMGLSTFTFVDPSGLADENVGSAKDLARLTAYALTNDAFKKYVTTKERTVTNVEGTISHELKNSNRLIGEWDYPGAIGVKTGFTPFAGHNLVAAIEKDGHTIIAVVMNTYSDTTTASAEVARDMLDYAKRAVEWR